MALKYCQYFRQVIYIFIALLVQFSSLGHYEAGQTRRKEVFLVLH